MVGANRQLSSVSSCSGAKREGKRRSAMLVDLEILDCPICYEALTIPIFQCDNGHLACTSCCPKLNNKCPTCDLSIGHSRCRAMESVLESLFVPCRCAELVCTRQLSYGKESTHEKECNFSPCSQENLEFFDAPENLCECHDTSSETAMPQPHLEDVQEEPLHAALPQAAPYFLPRDSSRFPPPPRYTSIFDIY